MEGWKTTGASEVTLKIGCNHTQPLTYFLFSMFISLIHTHTMFDVRYTHWTTATCTVGSVLVVTCILQSVSKRWTIEYFEEAKRGNWITLIKCMRKGDDNFWFDIYVNNLTEFHMPVKLISYSLSFFEQISGFDLTLNGLVNDSIIIKCSIIYSKFYYSKIVREMFLNLFY